MKHPDDAAARDRIRSSLEESLLVEAAAGTGKTHELVQRMVNVLAAGAHVSRMAAVSFTRKAAGELKIRLRQELDRTLRTTSDPAGQANLREALAHLEEAHIDTIHAFCAEVLRERPVEARVDPDFEELAEGEDRRLYARVFNTWLEGALGSPGPGLSRVLQRRPAWDRTIREDLIQAGFDLVEWRDFDAPWSTPEIDVARELDDLCEALFSAAAQASACTEPSDRLFRSSSKVRDLAAWLRERERDAPRPYAALEGRLSDLRYVRWEVGSGPYGPDTRRMDVVRALETLRTKVGTFLKRADAHLAAQLCAELRETHALYREAKEREGVLDFRDLVTKVRDLLTSNAPARRDLQDRFTHLFIDEYQDTDPIQTEIFLLLAADDPDVTDYRAVRPRPGKLFMVGDPKQSIYRFRRADVAHYQEMRDALASRGVGIVRLSHSYRATEPLQTVVNRAFGPHFTDDGPSAQPGYVPLSGGPPADSGQPSFVVLPAPRLEGKVPGQVRIGVVESGYPNAVATFIHWLLTESGWTVRTGNGSRGSIRPDDIAVLFRRFTSRGHDVCRPYTDALEAREVPHVRVGTRALGGRAEVDALRAALCAVEWPTDELSVYATLRGPFFALSDELLFMYRTEYGALFPLAERPTRLKSEHRPVFEALDLLGRLFRARNRVPFAKTVTRLLTEVRAHAHFALLPGGSQALFHIRQVVELAQNCELGRAHSFRGFLARLDEEVERVGHRQPSGAEETARGVRVMTAYSAKGLEFPVVVLADPCAPRTLGSAGRHIDGARRLAAFRVMGLTPQDVLDHARTEGKRDGAEGIRLAYVAATRARDLLVIPGLGSGRPERGPRGLTEPWYAPLWKVAYPLQSAWRSPEPAPGCPAFGADSALDAQTYEGRPAPTVGPGFHPGVGGGPGVVWWDPALVAPPPPRPPGLRQHALLQEDDEGHAAQSIERFAEWRANARAIRARGATRSTSLLSASDTEIAPPGAPAPVRAIALPRDPKRPSGRRFGTLLHAVVQRVPLDADRPAVEGLARLFGRTLGATSEEAEAVVTPVLSLLSHPLTERLRNAERVYRELPLTFATEDGDLLDGRVDLAAEDAHGFLVVELKTDADPTGHREAHVRQVQWYLHALHALTDRPVVGILVYV